MSDDLTVPDDWTTDVNVCTRDSCDRPGGFTVVAGWVVNRPDMRWVITETGDHASGYDHCWPCAAEWITGRYEADSRRR